MPRWSPDTCRCSVEYEAVGSDGSKWLGTRVVRTCPAHAPLANDPQAIYDALYRECCVLKSGVQRELEKRPELLEVVSLPDGDVAQRLKSGVEYRWAFDADRNLVVDLVGLRAESLEAIKLALAAEKAVKIR